MNYNKLCHKKVMPLLLYQIIAEADIPCSSHNQPDFSHKPTL